MSSGWSHAVVSFDASSQALAPASVTWDCSSVPAIPGSIAETRTRPTRSG
ncbi:hypothetical protein [Streptomyces fructofermentans]|nr:hypothetical protein [Streptomyces fructofermentans]